MLSRLNLSLGLSRLDVVGIILLKGSDNGMNATPNELNPIKQLGLLIIRVTNTGCLGKGNQKEFHSALMRLLKPLSGTEKPVNRS